MRALDADDSWTTIANEGERFTVSGTQTVRYGSGSTWITMQVNGSGECSNGAFGGDPLYGVVKECQTAVEQRRRLDRDRGRAFELHGERHADRSLRQRHELDHQIGVRRRRMHQ